MALLRQLLAQLPDEVPAFASELERRFYLLVRRARLPLPVVNGHVGLYQVDFHWPAQRLVVETDGRAFHEDPVAFRRDCRRDLDLELAGWHVLRFGWHDVVDEPDRVVALLRRYLATE
jgi:very-short-patch-repair endonuclease